MKLFGKLLSISALVIPGLANAASMSRILQVHVPFAFMVGSQQFGAGNYRIQQTENGVIYVQGEGRSALVISSPGEAKLGTASTLRFTSSQQHEYLVGVQTQGEAPRSLPIPVSEQRRVLLTPTR